MDLYLFLDTTRFFNLVEKPNEPDYSTIEIMMAGKWKHKKYGLVEITSQLMLKIRRNFERFNMAGRVPIDFNHGTEKEDPTQEEGKAAGWIQKLIMSPNGQRLLAVVKWTKAGADAIRSEEYQLFSPAYTGNYDHPSEKKPIGPWIHSRALTNRPFLKDMSGGMQPVALSDAAAQLFTHPPEKENPMKPEEIKALLERLKKDALEEGDDKLLSDNATDIAKYQLAKPPVDDKSAELAKLQKQLTDHTTSDTAKDKEIADLQEKIKLADMNDDDVVQLLKDTVKDQGDEIRKLSKSHAAERAERILDDAVQSKKLSKAERDSDVYQKLALSDPDILQGILENKPTVVPDVKGNEGKGPDDDTADKVVKFTDLVDKRFRELTENDAHDLTDVDLYRQATDEIAEKHPALSDAELGL